jgi:hypothetical protein
MNRLCCPLFLLIFLILPMPLLIGCSGSNEPAQVAPNDEPLRLGDESPLDQINAEGMEP